MNFDKIYSDLKAIPNCKTKDIDKYNKQLIKKKEDVSSLKEFVLDYPLVYRTYFQVSLGQIDNYPDQFRFIEENATLLQDWWHVDILIQFLKRPIDFTYAYNKARLYVNSDLTFLRRWGYVLFLTNLHKDYDNIVEILKLFKDDDKYYVQMGEAWLLAEMATNHFELIYEFIKNSSIKYNILGKAIQKICDSFKITINQKQRIKQLRAIVRHN